MAAGLSSFTEAYGARVFLALALGATAFYALHPGPTVQAVLAAVICAAAAVALAFRMRFAQVRHDAAWWLPLVGLLALLAAFAVSPHGFLAAGAAGAPVADGLAIADFACLIVALMLLACRRDGSRWATLDAVMIAAGLSLLALPVVDLVIEDGTLSVATRAALATCTIAGALLLAVSLRLFVTPGRRHPSLWLVLAGSGALVAAALSRDWLALSGHDGRTALELGLLLSAALVGTQALTKPDTTPSRRPNADFADRRGPVALILGALLVAPVMIAAVLVTDASRTIVVVVGIGATVMSLLLAARLIVLLDRSEQLSSELSGRNVELAERSLLFQAGDHAVFSCDGEGIVTSWNPAAERLYGYPAAEAIGRTIVELTAPPGEEHQLLAHRKRLLRGETLTGLHAARRRKDGSLFDAVLTISPARDETGEIVAYFSVVRDESEELMLTKERDELHKATRVAAEKLAEQVERMQELDRMKDDFVASVSHELRTPLTSIGGYLDLVLDRDADELSEQQRHFLEVVDRNSQRLLRLVNDLLDVAHLGAGELVLEPVACDAVALVADCVERAEPVARDRGIQLRLDAKTDAQLDADPIRIGQVVDNLLSNALKFTLDGGCVDVRVLDCPAGVAIEVVDDGMGISANVQERLFERFYRAPEATEHAIQGTGLGLWITKKIVVAHGGTIAVVSLGGRGSTFRIELPAPQPTKAEAAA